MKTKRPLIEGMGLSLLGKTKPFCFGTGTPMRILLKDVPGFVPPSSERSGCSGSIALSSHPTDLIVSSGR